MINFSTTSCHPMKIILLCFCYYLLGSHNNNYVKTTSAFSISSYSSIAKTVKGATITDNAIRRIAVSSSKRNTNRLLLFANKLNIDDINSKLQEQLELLKEKDKASMQLSKEDLKIMHEDEYILIVDKPSGVLTVSGEHPCLAKAVYDYLQGKAGDFDLSLDKIVVHRLGMDTSGLIVFAKTMEALRSMNTLFRTRKIQRQYEALLAGHMSKDFGIINLPIMRDYECPPYMRIATQANQLPLLDIDDVDEIIGYKKLLERPKASLTKYNIINREELDGGQPVTRVTLTSVSGRTHQLNVHCAAIGHPIVGDTIYGPSSSKEEVGALKQGGLTDDEINELIPEFSASESRLTLEEQHNIVSFRDKPCVHAKSIIFIHPITKESMDINSEAPF